MKKNTADILKKVRRIEIKTRGLSNQIFSGEYHSAFKGRGMAFSEVREYQVGDEIRTIDWNVTARFGHPYVKIFEEERELTTMLLIDVSGSQHFGTKNDLKSNIAVEIAAILAFSAIQNNDKVGVILFSDKVEKFIPPKKGRKHILMIIKELLAFEPESNKTDIKQALEYFNNVIKKRSTAFVISDFYTENDFLNALRIANKKHDVIGIQLIDKAEEEMPDAGYLPLQDEETGEVRWVNTSSKKVRTKFKANVIKHQSNLIETFRKSGVDYAKVETHRDYIKPLMNLFKRRELKR
ncbi:MAG TPA: DUF58 domain-containing protein [Flavobacteriales bacterium]|mgnify:CR=1 FL=1|nr:DUF58 domain-containing protein [Flavobacteriales bacterium]|tara:strand:+ start:37688 stop:38572 length:885 start_codon:yes stop_codon:yes gene_type:complete